jgi:methionine synthase II (cobalamin-independent)
MYVQYSTSLPAIKVDEVRERVYFDTSDDITGALEQFYSSYLAEDIAAFRLDPDYATGFYTLLDVLDVDSDGWVKGQVTGPISFGLTVTDQDLRPSLYHDQLADAIVKNMACNARWQIRELRSFRPNVILFVDEPYLAAFGSAFISLERQQAVTILNEVFAAIHQEGALAGVHCCANTDWSVLLATTVDILNLDAYGYLENLALYPAELRAFLDRDGLIAWGIVPNCEEIYATTPEGLARRLYQGLELIQNKADARGLDLTVSELIRQSLITTSCGLGPATVPVAEQALEILTATGEIIGQI